MRDRANLFASAARVASARFLAHCLASREAFKPAGEEVEVISTTFAVKNPFGYMYMLLGSLVITLLEPPL